MEPRWTEVVGGQGGTRLGTCLAALFIEVYYYEISHTAVSCYYCLIWHSSYSWLLSYVQHFISDVYLLLASDVAKNSLPVSSLGISRTLIRAACWCISRTVLSAVV